MLCQGKRAAAGGGATICRIDLYIVGSRQIFAVKILDVVGGNFFTVKKISKLLISRNYLWKRSTPP